MRIEFVYARRAAYFRRMVSDLKPESSRWLVVLIVLTAATVVELVVQHAGAVLIGIATVAGLALVVVTVVHHGRVRYKAPRALQRRGRWVITDDGFTTPGADGEREHKWQDVVGGRTRPVAYLLVTRQGETVDIPRAPLTKAQEAELVGRLRDVLSKNEVTRLSRLEFEYAPDAAYLREPFGTNLTGPVRLRIANSVLSLLVGLTVVRFTPFGWVPVAAGLAALAYALRIQLRDRRKVVNTLSLSPRKWVITKDSVEAMSLVRSVTYAWAAVVSVALTPRSYFVTITGLGMGQIPREPLSAAEDAALGVFLDALVKRA